MRKINKRTMAFVIICTILTYGICNSFAASIKANQPRLTSLKAVSPIKIIINGSNAVVPQYTHVVNGRVMIPLRWVAGKLNQPSVDWDGKTKTVFIKTNQAFHKLQKLSSYYHGLSDKSETEVWPAPERVKGLSFPKLPGNRPLNTGGGSNKSMVTICINDIPFAVYDYEFHANSIYVSSDLIEELLDVNVDYNKNLNKLSIDSLDEKYIDEQIQKIEDALVPASPEEALKLWGRGEQLRSGALQYAALSPELRKKAEVNASLNCPYWVTGGSSPWIGAITVKDEKKISETSIEYTLNYLEVTSAGSSPASEKLIVEKLNVNGRQGWYITRLILANSYYTIIPPESEFQRK